MAATSGGAGSSKRMAMPVRKAAAKPTKALKPHKLKTRNSGTPSKVRASRAVDHRAPSAVRNGRSKASGGGIDLPKFASEVSSNFKKGLARSMQSPTGTASAASPKQVSPIKRAMDNAPAARAALKKSLGR